MIDNKGKLFGKVSVIDIIVVVLICLAIFGVYKRFNSEATKIVDSNVKIQYVVRVNDIRMTSLEAIKKMGATYDSIRKTKIGEIVDVTYEPYNVVVTKSNGELTKASVPNKYTAYITIETEGKIANTGYLNPLNDVLSMSSEHIVMTKWFKSNGTIKYIEGIENWK